MRILLKCLLLWSLFESLAVIAKSQKHRKLPKHWDPTLPEPHSEIPIHHIERASLKRNLLGSEMAPLFPGYGTHYAYAYVGTPPQRQSLIIDTGSHYTAFPCTGCNQCGDHTDKYFSVKDSSTAVVPKCKRENCLVSQKYSEGSSWNGYKVVDNFWIGGEHADFVAGATNYAMNLTFACQTEETGLFRTQLADGIMGMSAAEDTCKLYDLFN
jgi:hypothetical protein